MPPQTCGRVPPATCPETQILARRVLASRGLSPFAAARPVDAAVGLLAAEARARAALARRALATAAGLVLAAMLLLISVALRDGGAPTAPGLEILAALGATAWGFVLLGPAADRHGHAAALRAALRRPGGPGHAFRVGILMGAPAGLA